MIHSPTCLSTLQQDPHTHALHFPSLADLLAPVSSSPTRGPLSLPCSQFPSHADYLMNAHLAPSQRGSNVYQQADMAGEVNRDSHADTVLCPTRPLASRPSLSSIKPETRKTPLLAYAMRAPSQVRRYRGKKRGSQMNTHETPFVAQLNVVFSPYYSLCQSALCLAIWW